MVRPQEVQIVVPQWPCRKKLSIEGNHDFVQVTKVSRSTF